MDFLTSMEKHTIFKDSLSGYGLGTQRGLRGWLGQPAESEKFALVVFALVFLGKGQLKVLPYFKASSRNRN